MDNFQFFVVKMVRILRYILVYNIDMLKQIRSNAGNFLHIQTSRLFHSFWEALTDMVMIIHVL